MKKMRVHTDKEGGLHITAIREIKILKRLQHDYMVRLHEVVTSKGSWHNFDPDDPDEDDENEQGDLFLVLEYVDHDLAGLIDERYEFTPTEIKHIMKQLFEVLKYIHGENFIHRDLKCSNLLLSHDMKLKLADFGLARCIEAPYTTNQAKELDKLTNTVITLWYRPPELLLGQKKYGRAVDIWSAGCILAELIIRHPLFQGKNGGEEIQ